MGNDGGSIPTRRELVKEAARNPTVSELKESQASKEQYYWTTDPLSRTPLVPPIVSDCTGKLYNKDTILEFLIGADEESKAEAEKLLQGNVKSLRDVAEVKFSVDGDAKGPDGREVWKCAITGDRLGPGVRAVYLVPCGHAFSASAIKEVSGERCLTCNESYAANDVIPIVPTAESDVARLALRVRGLRDRGLGHSLKKVKGDKAKEKNKEGKKRKHRDEKERENGASAAVADGRGGEGDARDATPVSRTSTPVQAQAQMQGIKNASTATLTAKVMAEQEVSKKRKLENENLKSLFSSRDPSKPHGKSADFMTRGFSIPASAKR
ncbi:Replication termination factor 2 [Zalaria obscura]|uniref:Replication termination factor 2 n=1 Tax=Zalaria obscura TaxID=2024903 RepID=A0ACC3S330_9PEZI